MEENRQLAPHHNVFQISAAELNDTDCSEAQPRLRQRGQRCEDVSEVRAQLRRADVSDGSRGSSRLPYSRTQQCDGIRTEQTVIHFSSSHATEFHRKLH
ncbi:uncharacterized [Tachysurus ichikawai]